MIRTQARNFSSGKRTNSMRRDPLPLRPLTITAANPERHNPVRFGCIANSDLIQPSCRCWRALVVRYLVALLVFRRSGIHVIERPAKILSLLRFVRPSPDWLTNPGARNMYKSPLRLLSRSSSPVLPLRHPAAHIRAATGALASQAFRRCSTPAHAVADSTTGGSGCGLGLPPGQIGDLVRSNKGKPPATTGLRPTQRPSTVCWWICPWSPSAEVPER